MVSSAVVVAVVDGSKWTPEEVRRLVRPVATLVIKGMGQVDGVRKGDTTIFNNSVGTKAIN